MLKIIKNRKGEEFQVLIDDEDEELFNQYKWNVNCIRNKYYYLSSSHKKKVIRFHRLVLDVKDSYIFIDHINGDTLDNRKENLRFVTNQQNIFNCKKQTNSISKYKGVTLTKAKKWIARIHFNNKNFHLGCFENEIDAAKAYDKKAKELFGKFAFLNFPED